MNSNQLRTALMREPRTKLFFQDVVSCNRIPKLQKNQIWIVNTATYQHKYGLHWLLLHTVEKLGENVCRVELLCYRLKSSGINDSLY